MPKISVFGRNISWNNYGKEWYGVIRINQTEFEKKLGCISINCPQW